MTYSPTSAEDRIALPGAIGPELPESIDLRNGYRFVRVSWCGASRYDMIALDGYTRVGGPWTPVDALTFSAAAAHPAAGDAALADVERLVADYGAAERAVGAHRDDRYLPPESTARDALSALLATIATLSAQIDTERREGEGEGPGLLKAEHIADHWHQRFMTLAIELPDNAKASEVNALGFKAMGAKKVLDEIKAERAQIAAAPATTGNSGDHHA